MKNPRLPEMPGPDPEAVKMHVAVKKQIQALERVKAGMESTRARGRKIRRPRSPVEVDAILAMRQQKYSWREIGKRLNCSPATALHKAKVSLQTVDLAVKKQIQALFDASLPIEEE